MSPLISLATTDEPIFLYPYQLGLVLSVAVLQPDAIHERVHCNTATGPYIPQSEIFFVYAADNFVALH